jgi:hypothetical protein
MFWKGSIAIDGLLGSGSTGCGGVVGLLPTVVSRTRYTRTGTGDVLYLLLPHVLEGIIKPVAHLVAHEPADADPASLGECLQMGRDIHPIAKDVVLLSDHVTEVDPDAEPYPPLLGNLRLAVGHSPLYLGGTANCVDHAREFGQQPVAGVLYDTAAVFVDLRIDQFPEVRLEPFVRPLLIRAHQARIPRHVGSEDRGEAADRGHGSSGGKVP